MFCERVVHLVEGIAIDSGYKVLASLQEQVQARHLTTFQRYVFDAWPRAAVLRPIVAEFGRYITLGVNPQNPEFVNNLLKKLPQGSQVVSRQLLSWEMFRVEMGDKLELESWSKKGCESPVNDQKSSGGAMWWSYVRLGCHQTPRRLWPEQLKLDTQKI